MKIDRSLWMFGVLALFLAFAPFYPEPHLIGKLNWVMGGAVGMKAMDYFDLFLHGGPILVVFFLFGISFGKYVKKSGFKGIKRHSARKTMTEA